MCDGAEPRNSYERKLKLIIDQAIARFRGHYTAEDYAMEHQVAENILGQLGVYP